MHDEKEIKIIPIKIGTGEKSKELKFVCMPHILESDPIIKTYLDGQKMKLNFSPAKISPDKFSKFDDDETVTGKSLSEAPIFASTNPQYDDRLFIELQFQYMKIPSSNLWRTCCVQKLF